MVHDQNSVKIQKARIIMAGAVRCYLTLVCGNLNFPTSILVEFLILAKFAGMVTALFHCIVTGGYEDRKKYLK